MIKTLFILIASLKTLCFAECYNEIKYTIDLVPSEKKLEITMAFQGDESGITEIELPISWTGQPFEEIVNLRCYSDTGDLTTDTTSLISRSELRKCAIIS